jgi:ribosomal protein S18 acetylase RimI-like enzyme
MSDITIEGVRDGDLAGILRDYHRFWGDRELARYLHHPMFFIEFGDTGFVARDQRTGEIVAYLLGFVAPVGDGYIHLIAVRDDARGQGLGRRLHQAFERAARGKGATGLKALTSPENEGSQSFHAALGFTDQRRVEDYGGNGRPRIVMRKSLR